MITNFFDIQCAERHAKPEGRWNGRWTDNPEISFHCEQLNLEEKIQLLNIDELRAEKPLKDFQLIAAEEMSKEAFKKGLFISEIPIELRRK